MYAASNNILMRSMAAESTGTLRNEKYALMWCITTAEAF